MSDFPGGTVAASRAIPPPGAPVREAATGGRYAGATNRQGGRTPNIPGGGTTDAQAQLREILDQWGLGGLLQWAWDKMTTGASPTQIIYELRQTSEYKTRFAGNVELQRQGHSPLSEADYLGWENQATQMFRYYDFPPTFFDQPEDFAKWIGGRVSITELHDRILERVAERDATPEDQRAWARLYGVTDGQQLAYFLDPQRAVSVLQRQRSAAQAAGAASRTGFGDISLMSAERLAALGITQQQAESGFTQLAGLREVTGQIVGDITPGMTEAEQIAASFAGDAAQQANLSRRQRGRLSAFQTTGGYVAGSGGATGIGPAQQ